MSSLTSIKARISIIILVFALFSLANAYIHLSSVKRSQSMFESNKQSQLDAYSIAHDIQNQLQVLSAFKQLVNIDQEQLKNSLVKLNANIVLLRSYFLESEYKGLLENFEDQSFEFTSKFTPFLEDLETLNANKSDSLFSTLQKKGTELGYAANNFQSLEILYILNTIKSELTEVQKTGKFIANPKSLTSKMNALNKMIEFDAKFSPEKLALINTYSRKLNRAYAKYYDEKRGVRNVLASANEFHSFLSQHHVRNLVKDIYLLRVYEYEVLSEHQLIYFDQQKLAALSKLHKSIFEKIESSNIEAENKEYLENALHDYINVLKNIIDNSQKVINQKIELTQIHRQLFDKNSNIFELLPKVFLTENSQIANRIKQESFLIACIYLLIAICIFIVFWMAINNRILSPLKNLQKAAKEYGEGKKEVKVDIQTKDELGQLAQTFNAMTSQLDSNNSQLVKSLEAITLQDENKRNFVAMISHEIRTPLNGIIGMAYLAQQSNTDLKVQSYLDSIFKSSNSLLSIINDLMDFSKIESSKFDITPANSNLTHTLDQVCTTVGLFAEGKKLPFMLEIDSSIPQMMKFDALRLQQVLINLCNNSIKFTQEGQVLIKITHLNKTSKKKVAKLKFSIIDTGPGLTKEQVESIFTPFKQADNSITRKFGGTGLGLSISQEIINLMNSEIKIFSTLGEGSEFYFELALPIVGEPQEMQASNFLLFTDDSLLKQNIQNNICKQDILLHANNVDQTKEYIGDTQFDYIILDWQSLDDSLDEKKLIVEALQKSPAIVMVLSDIQHFTTLKNFSLPLTEQYKNRLILSNKPFIHMNIINPQWDKETTPTSDFYNESLYIKGKVLVVEDDLINQQVMTELLKSFGLDVYVADNGREAINMANKIYPDVVLMDIEMPGMDGYQTCHELRQQNQFVNTPIIALSGHEIRNSAKYTQAKFDDALVKPIDPTALHRLLQSNLMHQLNEQKLVQLSKQDDLALLTTFDYNSGLKRVAGEKQLYINLIKEFHSHFSDAKLVLDMLVQADDFEPASKYCHRLRGVSANLGNTKLHNILTTLENELKEQNPKKESLQQFEQCFTESISEINLFLQTLPKANEKVVNSKFETKEEIFNGLYRYIDNTDGEIIDYFHEHKKVFKQILNQKDFDQLDDAINHFNFAKAATILNSVAK